MFKKIIFSSLTLTCISTYGMDKNITACSNNKQIITFSINVFSNNNTNVMWQTKNIPTKEPKNNDPAATTAKVGKSTLFVIHQQSKL